MKKFFKKLMAGLFVVFFVLTFYPANNLQATGNVTLDDGYYGAGFKAIKDGDNIYFFVSEDGVYQYNVASAKEKKLIKSKASFACIYKSGDNIYLTSAKTKLKKIKVDGKTEKVHMNMLQIYNLKTKKVKTVLKEVMDAVVVDGYIFYTKPNGKKYDLYRLNSNGKKRKLLAKNVPQSAITIRKKHIYYATGHVNHFPDGSIVTYKGDVKKGKYWYYSYEGKKKYITKKGYENIGIKDWSVSHPEKGVKANTSSEIFVTTGGKKKVYSGRALKVIVNDEKNKEKELYSYTDNGPIKSSGVYPCTVFKDYMIFSVNFEDEKNAFREYYVMNLSDKSIVKIATLK